MKMLSLMRLIFVRSIVFLALSEMIRGRWKGSFTAVKEVRKTRKHRRGY